MSTRPARSIRKPALAPVADPIVDIHNRLDEHAEKLSDHDARITAIESLATDIKEMAGTVQSIMKYLKIATPSLISAAVAAGIVNGKLAEFFKALLSLP